MPLPPGHVLRDRYRIVALLGEGGFGAVYRAWDGTMDHACAVKENGDTSPEAQRQFLREAQILFKLRHPNLPVVYDTFLVPDQGQYLVMDFVEGEDLGTIIARGPVAEAQALAWMDDVLDALAYLHNQEPPIIHRDVKPANVRVTPSGRAVLVDFGLAKVYDPRLKTTLGARAVTPGYAPIEQYGQGRTDARTDVYAAGATLYAALTGEDPAEATDRLAGIKPLTPPRELNPDISPYVAVAVERALENRPVDRFADATLFRRALREPPPETVPPSKIPAKPEGAVTPKAPAISDAAASPSEAQRAIPHHQLAPSPAPLAAPSSRLRRLPRWLWPLTLAFLALAIVLAVVLLNGDGETGAEATPPTVAAAAPTVAEEEEAELTHAPTEVAAGEAPGAMAERELVIWADEVSAGVLASLAEPFFAEFGVALRIDHYELPAAGEHLAEVADAGTGPDIVAVSHRDLQWLVEQNLVRPFDPGDKAGAFLPPALDAFVYEGALYGLPYQMDNVAFVYNPDLVPHAPETWEEVLGIAAELEATGAVVHGFGLIQDEPYHAFPIMSAFGGYIFGSSPGGFYDTSDVGLDSEGSIAAGQWLARMVVEGHLQPASGWDEMHDQFVHGETAMIITGPWALDFLRDTGASYAIAPPPGAVQPGSPFIEAQGFVLGAHSENEELAKTFLTEYIATRDPMHTIAEHARRPSPYLPALEKTTDPDLRAFGDAAHTGIPIPPLAAMETVWGPWGNAQALVVSGSATPEDAFGDADDEVRAAISP